MKTQKGESVINILIFMTIIAFAVYNYWIIPTQNEQALNKLGSTDHVPTAKEARIIDEFKNKPTPTITPSGTYKVTGTLDDLEYEITYEFDDNQSIYKKLTIEDKYSLSGSARYSFKGSVLMYDEVNGDKYLFPVAGEPISIPNEQTLTTHVDRGPIEMKSYRATTKEKELKSLSELTVFFPIAIGVVAIGVAIAFVRTYIRMRDQ